MDQVGPSVASSEDGTFCKPDCSCWMGQGRDVARDRKQVLHLQWRRLLLPRSELSIFSPVIVFACFFSNFEVLLISAWISEVHHVTRFDAGFYNCTATNTEGMSSCTSEVIVEPTSVSVYCFSREKEGFACSFQESISYKHQQ